MHYPPENSTRAIIMAIFLLDFPFLVLFLQKKNRESSNDWKTAGGSNELRTLVYSLLVRFIVSVIIFVSVTELTLTLALTLNRPNNNSGELTDKHRVFIIRLTSTSSARTFWFQSVPILDRCKLNAKYKVRPKRSWREIRISIEREKARRHPTQREYFESLEQYR